MQKGTLFSLLLAASLQAERENLDELFGGFEEKNVDMAALEAKQEAQPTAESGPLSSYGALTFATSYNYAQTAPVSGETDYRSFSRARTKLDLGFDLKLPGTWQAKVEFKAFYDALYVLRDRKEYSNDTLATYESETELKEAYLLGSLSENLDLKIGRQIVVWGKSDNIRLTDVINPLDNREPGMVDIEDLRLPVGMTKLDYYSGSWNLSVMAIHENRVQKEAAVGSEFFPVQIFPFPPGFVFPEDETPKQDMANGQYALALNGRFSGWDLSIYRAGVLDAKWHFEEQRTERRYSQITMSGAAANLVSGSFLFKTEAAYLQNLRFNTTTEKKNRTDFLVGLEYQGISDTVISIEEALRHIEGHEKIMESAPDFLFEDEKQTALRISYSFDNDRGSLTYLLSRFVSLPAGTQDGGFQRAWVSYDLKDALNLTLGAVDYLGGDKSFFDAIRNNDRIFADLKYSF